MNPTTRSLNSKKAKIVSHVYDFCKQDPRRPITFTELQRFIVDMNYGAGTYDRARKEHGTAKNPYRGYYCTQLSDRCTAYLMHGLDGLDYLVKVDGGYVTNKNSAESILSEILS